ncbi:MAG: AAA family ATPase, partial [Waterburya sp.]
MTALLIAGTDTDVGKTFVTIALAAYWQKYQLTQELNNNSLLSIFKLMQTGTGDGELYQQLFASTPGIEVIVP